MSEPVAGPIRPADEPALFTAPAAELVLILDDEPEHTREHVPDQPGLF